MRELLVFLVEDSTVHQRLVQQAFAAAGHPVRLQVHDTAERAWEAIQMLRMLSPNQWPDLAIVDVGLPGESGIDLVDRIRQLPHFADWPVVMLTASEDQDDQREAILAKATAYFHKPTERSGYTSLVKGMLTFLGIPPAEPAPSRQKPTTHSQVRTFKPKTQPGSRPKA